MEQITMIENLGNSYNSVRISVVPNSNEKKFEMGKNP